MAPLTRLSRRQFLTQTVSATAVSLLASRSVLGP